MADYGQKARCCQVLSAAELHELAEEGRPLDCGACDHAAKQAALWPVNADAYSIYRSLCGRTVGLLELHGWLFLSLTAGWTLDEQQDALARLDVIQSVLSPDESARGADGRSAQTRHSD